MSPTLANFLFEAANFLLLSAALGWLLFKPVRAALDRERAAHTKDAEDSKRLREEAEALAKDASASREAAAAESDRQRAEILAGARKEQAAILEKARRDQAAERSTFLSELQSTKEAQAAALTESVGRIAAESVRQLLITLEGPALDLALARAAAEQLRALPAAVRRQATVESARTLDADARRVLEGVLGAPLTERTVEELGAGVRVTTSAGQIDATAASIAREAAHAMSATLAEKQAPGSGVDA